MEISKNLKGTKVGLLANFVLYQTGDKNSVTKMHGNVLDLKHVSKLTTT